MKLLSEGIRRHMGHNTFIISKNSAGGNFIFENNSFSFHVFFTLYAISNIYNFCVQKTFLSHFMFSSCFFLGEILKNVPSFTG